MLDGNLSIKLKRSMSLGMWTAPQGEVTIDVLRDTLGALSQALVIAEADYTNYQIQDAIIAMKSFIDEYKVIFGINYEDDEVGELISEIEMVLVRVDKLMMANAQSWRNTGYIPPRKRRRRGRRR